LLVTENGEAERGASPIATLNMGVPNGEEPFNGGDIADIIAGAEEE
jgi:hypothetical protein